MIKRFLLIFLKLLLANAFLLAGSTGAGVSNGDPEVQCTKIPLALVQNIPFIHVVVGKSESELMFDSGGMLGVTLPNDVISRSGSVQVLETKSKRGDAAGHVYDVSDILASNVSVGGLPLMSPIKGSVHYHWGLEASSGDSKEPDNLKAKRANGSIGLEAFSGKALLFDYQNRELRIYSESPVLLDHEWQSLPLEYSKVGPQVLLRIGGRQLKFILDTGANVSVLIPSALDPIKYPDICIGAQKGNNYCGHMDLQKVSDQSGNDIGAIAVEIIKMQGVPFDGLLGANFFESHLVLFDVANHKVMIKRI